VSVWVSEHAPSPLALLSPPFPHPHTKFQWWERAFWLCLLCQRVVSPHAQVTEVHSLNKYYYFLYKTDHAGGARKLSLSLLECGYKIGLLLVSIVHDFSDNMSLPYATFLILSLHPPSISSQL
jgi:hypothetical protein